MKAARCVLVGTVSLVVTFVLMLPPLAWCAKTPGATPAKKGKPMPSERIRHMIDTTLPMISSLGNAKPPANRAALTEAEAEWTALAQTAPPAEQPMYTAAANAVHMLLAAEDEHTTAVANNKYSKSVHGKQDHQDARISNGGQAPGTAFANNAKQNQENAQFRKEELRKEQFMNTGASAEWTTRVEQIRAAVEQVYTAELVAEKQVIAARKSNRPRRWRPDSPPAVATQRRGTIFARGHLDGAERAVVDQR